MLAQVTLHGEAHSDRIWPWTGQAVVKDNNDYLNLLAPHVGSEVGVFVGFKKQPHSHTYTNILMHTHID